MDFNEECMLANGLKIKVAAGNYTTTQTDKQMTAFTVIIPAATMYCVSQNTSLHDAFNYIKKGKVRIRQNLIL